MKVAVWCSTGNRPSKRKSTDAENIKELKGFEFYYMDTDVISNSTHHIRINLLNQPINEERLKNAFDAIVLENCPINLHYMRKKDPILLQNCMYMLKPGGQLFARLPSFANTYGPFEKDHSIDLLTYTTESQNKQYMIFTYQPRISGEGTTVKELQAICKKNHLPYSRLRKAELIQLLKKMNLI